MYTWTWLAVVLYLDGSWYVSLPGVPGGELVRLPSWWVCLQDMFQSLCCPLGFACELLECQPVGCSWWLVWGRTVSFASSFSGPRCGLSYVHVHGGRSSDLSCHPSVVGLWCLPYGSATDGSGVVLDVPLLPSDGKLVATATVSAPSGPPGTVAPGDGSVGKCTGSAVFTSASSGPSALTTHGHGRDPPLPGEYSDVMQGFLTGARQATVRPPKVWWTLLWF